MNLNAIDMNLLVALDALLVERNVTRAASRLSVGQSAMSASLGRLRRLLDDPLLVRQGNRLVATPRAEKLAEPLSALLESIEALLRGREEFHPETSEQRFVIAASEYVTLTLLHPLIEQLRAEAPGVTLRITPENADIAEELRRGEIDLLIHPLEIFDHGRRFEREVLFVDRYVCAVDAASELAGEKLSLDEFLDLPYLATAHGNLLSIAETQLDTLNIPVRRELTVSATLAPYVLRGTPYVSLILERLARAVADHAGIRILEPPVTLSPVNEAMFWNTRSTHDPAHAWLRRRLHQLARELQED